MTTVASSDVTDTSGFNLDSITFISGYVLDLLPGEVVLVVGPNNTGKSTLLREVGEVLSGSERARALVATDASWRISCDRADVRQYVESFDDFALASSREERVRRDATKAFFAGRSPNFDYLERDIADFMGGEGGRVGARFYTYQDAEARLAATKIAKAVDAVDGNPEHPAQVLYLDDSFEEQISAVVREVFGHDLVVDRGAPNEVILRFGSRPALRDGEDRVSVSYLRRLRELPLLTSQGEGVKSFVGTMLSVTTSPAPLLLLDEPQVFLHPPEARRLGSLLATQLSIRRRQAIIATHSSDFVRGLLEEDALPVTVLRLDRRGNEQVVSTLGSGEIREVMNDPIMVYSGAFDAVFSKYAILCEGGTDCLFYEMRSAVLGVSDAVSYIQTGGKSAFAKYSKALRALGVPVVIIADFDLLLSADVLQRTFSGKDQQR